MRQLMKLFEAELKSTLREKAVWFWLIFFPVILFVIFTVIIGGAIEESDFETKVVTVIEKPSQAADQLNAILHDIDVFKWAEDEPVSLETARELVKDRKVDAAIVLPAGNESEKVVLLMNKEKENSATAQALSGILARVLEEMNYRLANATPTFALATEYLSSGGNQIKFVDFLMTGMLALGLAQSGLFGQMGLVEYRRNGLQKRLMLTPIKMHLFGIGHIMVHLILGVIQVIVITLIGVLFFKVNLNIDFLAFIIVFAVGVIAFNAMGYMLASFSKTQESYSGLANIASFLMMFISGVFFDLAMLPEYIRPVSNVIPLTYFVSGIRDSMVYGLGVTHAPFWINIAVMAAWGLAAFIIGTMFSKRRT